ncbi:MAG TPA: aldo/keto reductase [Alphaproteobacteria bacterium]|nr:aldo/keto reductase [Alphaproteobacteria bacterium]
MSIPRIQLPGGLSCSNLGFGTFGIGGKYESDDSHDADSIKIIHRVLDLGINLFDTAEVYGAGRSEEVLGMALRGKRHQAVIASKFNAENSKKEKMIAACEASLKRLQTDVIDLYQTHWPNPAVPPEDIAAGFEHLVKSGKVRAIGFSNATSALMKKITALLPKGFPIASSQQEYNLAERSIERLVLPYCRANNMALLAYSPLGKGKLLDQISQDYGISPATLALQWLMQRDGVIPIPATSKIKHLEENVAAVTTPLAPEILEKADKAFRKEAKEIPVDQIDVVASHSGKAYTNLLDAKSNTLKLSPSPTELASELMDGEMLKPVKVRAANGRYALYEGQLRYWAWRIAHNDKLPVVAQVDT